MGSNILWDKATNADALVCKIIKSDANRPSDIVRKLCVNLIVCVCVCVCCVLQHIPCASSL